MIETVIRLTVVLAIVTAPMGRCDLVGTSVDILVDYLVMEYPHKNASDLHGVFEVDRALP